jgi:hypothetical protein
MHPQGARKRPIRSVVGGGDIKQKFSCPLIARAGAAVNGRVSFGWVLTMGSLRVTMSHHTRRDEMKMRICAPSIYRKLRDSRITSVDGSMWSQESVYFWGIMVAYSQPNMIDDGPDFYRAIWPFYKYD